jgi:hypothetical protein
MPDEGDGPTPSQGDDPGDLTEKAGVPIGIATGVLGALLAIGFALLPVSTNAEKSYVITASLTLSVASVSGIGAWRSGLRFSFTAGLTAVALACLAVLSVVAQAGSTQGASTSLTPAASPSQSLSPSSPPGSPAAGTEQLIDMPPVSALSSAFRSGAQSVDSHTYQQTLSDGWDDAFCTSSNVPDKSTYTLDYKYRQFSVVVGLADTSPSGDTMQFSVLVDGQAKGPEPTVEVGQTATISVNVAGAYRVTLRDLCISATNPTTTLVTAVWINPTVSG